MRVDRIILEANDRGELPKMSLKPHQRVEVIILPDDVDNLRTVAEKNLKFWDNNHDECWNDI